MPDPVRDPSPLAYVAPPSADTPDAGVTSAGVPSERATEGGAVDSVDGGVRPGGVFVDRAGTAPNRAVSDRELGERFVRLSAQDGPVAQQLLDDVVREMEARILRTNGPPGSAPGRPANTMVSPEVGLAILDNVANGRAPFKPELGKGSASWFVTEGDPYVGQLRGKDIPVRVEIVPPEAEVSLGEAELHQMYQRQLASTRGEAEAEIRRRFEIGEDVELPGRARRALRKLGPAFAETRMWDEVGRMAGETKSGVLEVVLEPGSQFSRQGQGRFAVVAEPEAIRLGEGVMGVVEGLEATGAHTPPELRSAADDFATKMKWAGRVRAAFHYGGRVLLVVGVAADTYAVATADNKPKALATSLGGWAGAFAASGAFGTFFAPADVAGPVAWCIHGTGTLIAGAGGYWLGSESVRYTYELVEPEPR